MTTSTPLSVALEQVAPVVVVSAAGDVDAATTPALEEALDGAIREHERHVVLDGRDIGFIDSTGISAIIAAMRRLNRARRRFALVHGPGALARSLQVTGLDRTLEVHATVDSAVAELAEAPLLGR
jgi:anti-anti-sigma factor